jgi:hypothetical protein
MVSSGRKLYHWPLSVPAANIGTFFNVTTDVKVSEKMSS